MLRYISVMFLAAGTLFGQAQSNSGDVKGTVLDPAGGVIPNAKVGLSDAGRGISRTSQTDAQGGFVFTAVPPGVYHLKVEAQGFAPKELEGLEVRVGDTVKQA